MLEASQNSSPQPHALPPVKADTGLQIVRMIGLYFGKTADAQWLWNEYAVAQEGFNRLSVIRSLQHLGFEVQLRPSKPKALQRAAFPAVIELRDGRFALIGKVEHGQAHIQIPNEPSSQTLPLEQLLALMQPHWMVIVKRASRSVSEKFGVAWFMRALMRYKGLLGETLAASFALQILALVSPFAFQVVIDKVLVHRGLSTLDVIVLGIAICSLFEVLLSGIRTYMLTHTTHRVDSELGAKIYKHILGLPMTYFASRKVGEIVARVREMEAIRTFFTGTGLTSGVDLIFTVFFLAVMAYYSPALTLVVLVSLPLFFGISVVLIPMLNKHVEDRFIKAADNQAFLVETIAGVETLKSMTAESRFQRQWEERLADYGRCSFKTGHLANITQQGVQWVNKVLSLVLLWLGAKLVLAGDISVGQLIAFNMLSARVNAPILRLATLWQEMQQMRVSMRRLGDILDTPTEAPPSASLSFDRLQGAIAFEGVAFKYTPEGRDILREVSLAIAPGELVGIVGSSGSGKSTLAKLLLRLYVPHRGRVLLDGADISGIHPALIRQQVAVVTQDVTLFSTSVRDNISMGHADIEFDAIVRAAQLAGADEFIRKLPQGYDTVLGERGSNLSGGQRQRLAIARALVNNPRILILDEATSMLDADTEMRFWRHIRELAQQRTILAITHRLSTVMDMDRIVVLEDGAVIESGTPETLWQQNTRFRQLYEMQMGVSGKTSESTV